MNQMITTFAFLICALVLLTGNSQAQQTATTNGGRKVVLNADGTWKYATTTPTKGVTLHIEAGIVYKTGGPQPVARTTFYLLDTFPLDDIEKLPATPGDHYKNGAEEFMAYCGESPKQARELVAQHVRYRFTTGLDGKAQLTDISPGKYYLFGMTETRARSGCALWINSVDLTKDQSLILDQNNAVVVQ